jgi:methylase of polypeptide subunit release factors
MVGDLHIGWDDRVLEPRPWTLAQSRWAAELLDGGPEGAVLELCAGVGYVGIDLALTTGRRVVQVDRHQVACDWAVRNAAAAGVGDLVDVRRADLADLADLAGALLPEAPFALVLADPPYLPSTQVADHPLDPPHAIDGGADGLDLARLAVTAGARHLVPAGPFLLQVRGPRQAEAVAAWLSAPGSPDLFVVEVLVHDPDRAVALLRDHP